MMFFIIFFLCVVAMFIACIYITSRIFDYIFQRSTEVDNVVVDDESSDLLKNFYAQQEETVDWMKVQPQEKVEITSKDGLTLRGTLYRLHENNDKVILAIHGYHGTGFHDMACFGKMYERLGYDALLIDQRACGDSDGDYVSFGYHEQEDGVLWCQKLIEIYGENVEIVLHGLSSGGATVCNMSGNENLPKQVAAIISDCSFDTMKTQFRHSLHTQTQLPVEFTLWLMNYFCKQRLHFRFKDNNQTNAVEKAKVPMLFIHGDKDDYVPFEMLEFLYDSCASIKKEQLVIQNAKYKAGYTVDPMLYEKVVKRFLGV